MNLYVVRPDGSWYVRPDITLVRDADRFCLPDDFSGARAWRCRCFRIDKAGKAVMPRFARRYVSEWAPGICFYGQRADSSCTPYLDRSTWVAREFQPLASLSEASVESALEALSRVSSQLSLRIGDFLLLEYDSPAELQRGQTLDNITIV